MEDKVLDPVLSKVDSAELTFSRKYKKGTRQYNKNRNVQLNVDVSEYNSASCNVLRGA